MLCAILSEFLLSFTVKIATYVNRTECNDITEILLKLALNTNQSINNRIHIFPCIKWYVSICYFILRKLFKNIYICRFYFLKVILVKECKYQEMCGLKPGRVPNQFLPIDRKDCLMIQRRLKRFVLFIATVKPV